MSLPNQTVLELTTVKHQTNYFIAQQVTNPDFGGQVSKAWNNFVSTGQIWALIIGIVVGYIFRGINRS